jgi:predicted aspartyl protease
MRPNADHTAYLVPVAVGDRTLQFEVDTGASGSTITPAACAKARARCGGEATTAAGAGGEIAVPTANVPLRLGDWPVRNLELAVMDLPVQGDPAADGILGRDLLGDDVVQLDFANGRLVLGAQAHGDGVPFASVLDGLIETTVAVDGTPIKAVVDVGASHTILNQRAAARLTDAVPGSAGGAAALGADGKPIAMTSIVATSLALGQRMLDRPTLFVADLPVFGTFGLETEPAMIVGLDVLARGSVVIDYRNHTIAASAL